MLPFAATLMDLQHYATVMSQLQKDKYCINPLNELFKVVALRGAGVE